MGRKCKESLGWKLKFKGGKWALGKQRGLDLLKEPTPPSPPPGNQIYDELYELQVVATKGWNLGNIPEIMASTTDLLTSYNFWGT